MDIATEGQRYVHEAIEWDDPRIISLLVKNGVPVDAQNGDGETLLLQAVLRNRYKAAKALLELGANPKARDFSGWSPAQNAGYRSIEMCKLFLDHGVGIDDQDGGGETMLMNAVNLPENFDIVKFLVKSGASLNVRNKKGETALGIARRAKQDFQQRIDMAFNPNYPEALDDPERARAEMTATLQQYEAVVQFLKQNGGEE